MNSNQRTYARPQSFWGAQCTVPAYLQETEPDLSFWGKAICNEVQTTELWLLIKTLFVESNLDGNSGAIQGVCAWLRAVSMNRHYRHTRCHVAQCRIPFGVSLAGWRRSWMCELSSPNKSVHLPASRPQRSDDRFTLLSNSICADLIKLSMCGEGGQPEAGLFLSYARLCCFLLGSPSGMFCGVSVPGKT